MAGIRLEAVCKRFGDVVAVGGVSLDIRDGEFMVFVGPSGCGKSTLLRMIAGLEDVSDGAVFLGDEDVTRLQPGDRDIAMVFQNYALYPHMSVEQNLAFGLKLRRLRRAEIQQRVLHAASILGLDTLLDRKPSELSGGQRQRVAIGRAIVREPQAFLMDEPLSNLDAKLRVQMRAELARLRDRLQTTTVYVTHDQVEAMTLGDRVAVLKDGELQQVDTPQELFHAPANVFVASFIGSPSMNLVRATIRDGRVCFGGHELPCPESVELGGRGEVVVGIRPTDFEDAALGWRPGQPTLDVTAEVTEELGSEILVIFSVDAEPVNGDRFGSGAPADEEDDVRIVRDERSAAATFTARVDGSSSVAAGGPLRLSISSEALYFFDAATGVSLGRSARQAARTAAAPAVAG